jgi:hypothetical protein
VDFICCTVWIYKKGYVAVEVLFVQGFGGELCENPNSHDGATVIEILVGIL